MKTYELYKPAPCLALDKEIAINLMRIFSDSKSFPKEVETDTARLNENSFLIEEKQLLLFKDDIAELKSMLQNSYSIEQLQGNQRAFEELDVLIDIGLATIEQSRSGYKAVFQQIEQKQKEAERAAEENQDDGLDEDDEDYEGEFGEEFDYEHDENQKKLETVLKEGFESCSKAYAQVSIQSDALVKSLLDLIPHTSYMSHMQVSYESSKNGNYYYKFSLLSEAKEQLGEKWIYNAKDFFALSNVFKTLDFDTSSNLTLAHSVFYPDEFYAILSQSDIALNNFPTFYSNDPYENFAKSVSKYCLEPMSQKSKKGVLTFNNSYPAVACAAGEADVAQFLLNYGFDFTQPFYRGRTCAHWAALNGQLDILEIIAEKVDLNTKDSDGFSVVGMLFCKYEDFESVNEENKTEIKTSIDTAKKIIEKQTSAVFDPKVNDFLLKALWSEDGSCADAAKDMFIVMGKKWSMTQWDNFIKLNAKKLAHKESLEFIKTLCLSQKSVVDVIKDPNRKYKL